MNNGAVRKPTYFTVVSVLLTVLIMSFSNFYILGYMDDVTNKMVAVSTDILPSVYHLRSMQTILTTYRLREFRHTLASDSLQLLEEERVMTEKMKAYREQEKELTALFSSVDEQQDYDELSALFEEYRLIHLQILALSRKKNKEQAQELLYGNSRIAFNNLYSQFDTMIESYLKQANQQTEMVKKMQTYARFFSRAITYGSILLCLLWITIIWRRRA